MRIGYAHALCGSSRRAADRQAFHAQRRLADTYRHRLAVLPASADARVELHVVADHGDLGHGHRAVADQRGAFDGRAHLAVLDQVALGTGEHELAGRDVDLTAAEIDRIDTLRHRRDDLLRSLVA